MFKNRDNKVVDSKDTEIERLNNIILDLQTQLDKVAADNGSVVVKMLPDGRVEVNGTEMDNTTEVEYYNSSQATFGELTMFRVGKEAKQREMNKLIEAHMNECDRYKQIIDNLNQDVANYVNMDKNHVETIDSLTTELNNKNSEIDSLKQQLQDTIDGCDATLAVMTKKYDGLIKGLEDDIQNWKERYLELNNIRLDGTIITQYGEYNGNQETEDINND